MMTHDFIYGNMINCHVDIRDFGRGRLNISISISCNVMNLVSKLSCRTRILTIFKMSFPMFHNKVIYNAFTLMRKVIL